MISIITTSGASMIKNLGEEIDSYYFVLEPSFENNGSVHSWEILTKGMRRRNPDHEPDDEKEFIFHLLSEQDRINIFNKQLLIMPTLDQCRIKGKPISINVDNLISDYILHDKYVCEFFKKSKNISIEINEEFHEFKNNSCMRELETLSGLCPVWLDDFGRGFTSIQLIKSFDFECIKIDKDYFWEIQYDSDFSEKINKIKSYSKNIIVEGVESIEQKDKVFSICDIACQGRLWVNHYYYIEC